MDFSECSMNILQMLHACFQVDQETQYQFSLVDNVVPDIHGVYLKI